MEKVRREWSPSRILLRKISADDLARHFGRNLRNENDEVAVFPALT